MNTKFASGNGSQIVDLDVVINGKMYKVELKTTAYDKTVFLTVNKKYTDHFSARKNSDEILSNLVHFLSGLSGVNYEDIIEDVVDNGSIDLFYDRLKEAGITK